MSTTDARHRRVAWWGGILAALAVVVTLAAVTAGRGDGETAAGMLTGGLLVVALAAIARVRVARRGGDAATASRVLGGEPDERDRLVHLRAAATVGFSAFLVAPSALVAHALGADAESLLSALPWVFVGVGVVSFVVLDRRS